MKTSPAVTGLLVLGIVAGFAWVLTRPGGPPPGIGDNTADASAGRRLYAENCAACHGANLEGQPDWQVPGPDGRLPAPPHDATGHTWHHPDSLLFSYVKLGGKAALAEQGIEFDSGMPGFADALSDAEIRDILAFLKASWPDRERQVQAERTQLDENARAN